MENISDKKLLCHDCGLELADDADFCSFCGVRIDRTRLGISDGPETPVAESTPAFASPYSASAAFDEPVSSTDVVDDEEDDKPTVLYSSKEFENLTGDIITESDASAEEDSVEVQEEAAVEEPLAEESVEPQQTEVEESLAEESLAEESAVEEPVSEDIPAEVAEVSEPEEVSEITDVREMEEVPEMADDRVAEEAGVSDVFESDAEGSHETEVATEAEQVPEPVIDTESSIETETEIEDSPETELESSSSESFEEDDEDTPTLADSDFKIAISDDNDESEISGEEQPASEDAPQELAAQQPNELDAIDTMEDIPEELPSAPGFLATMAEEIPEAGPPQVEGDAGTGEDKPVTNEIDSPGSTGGKKASKSQVLTEGTLLYGRYEIVRKIGGGGMGAVYLATDRNLGGVLRAVKEMVQTHIEEDQQEKALADFKRESLLLTSLEHPCIPTIYDYFIDDTTGRFYLVMKYISGGDLSARLRSTPEGKIDEKSVTEWAAQAADVLDYLHSRRPPIVYRDLKPSNLMIDGNTGRIMLIDFGIARWVTKNEKDVTAVGTMGYAPPELFSGNVEPRSDIYSLGATMFHLMTGADPQSNPLLIFDFTKHPRPRQVNPNISNEMEQILMRAVEYNVELRYTTAGELREALMNHLERVRYGQLSYGPPQTGAPSAPAPAANSTPGISAGQNLVFCGFCGEKIIANDVFCPYCGAKQAVADQLRQSPQFVSPIGVVSSRRVLARVAVLGTGSLEPPMYNLEKDSNIVGRRDPQTNIFPEVDLSKFDPQTKVSRRHARIWKEGEAFMVEDLGSSNGTVIVSSMNEAYKLPPHQPQVLVHGSKLVVGDTTLHFIVA